MIKCPFEMCHRIFAGPTLTLWSWVLIVFSCMNFDVSQDFHVWLNRLWPINNLLIGSQGMIRELKQMITPQNSPRFKSSTTSKTISTYNHFCDTLPNHLIHLTTSFESEIWGYFSWGPFVQWYKRSSKLEHFIMFLKWTAS